MRLVRLRAPGGLDRLDLVEEDPPRPGRVTCWSGDDFAVCGKTRWLTAAFRSPTAPER
ncbi:hypothetical protein [Mesorhizobium opportunistum]|uniref:Uncharacterized protein n=1 Tax=Mesorhizobium opportunistum (strain LMG 24607 / HAMBI 3007 / WSM2075) TaxID=536019 RepID=F7YBH7_MESOW|nr:hypothetical protein [Mesorhizobium opportunistum]AEH87724.1 hypothetical protein Mesop_3273 [Mesorhizobium opportunistum WSM2075]